MFRTHSPYSPFFTSGLLSASSRPHTPDVPLSPRRGSLPTDATRSSDTTEDVSAFYFTLQPRRDEDQFRSFLSLDLAESQSMRSASLKRKASSSTKARSTRTASTPFRFPRISEVSLPAPPPAAPANLGPAPTPLRMRFSRDSLRTIPSPKPAPSITLPELPKVAHSPPRLPSLRLTSSLNFSLDLSSPTAPVPSSSSLPRTVPQLKLDLDLHHRVSVATKASSSTASTRVRRYNRSEALARLEGRVRPDTAPLIASTSASTSTANNFSPNAKRNFMSMSDDEDSDSDDDADRDNVEDDLSDLDSLDFPDVDLLDPLMEPEDMVLPLPSPAFYLEAPRSAPLPPRPRESPPPVAGGFFGVQDSNKRSSTLDANFTLGVPGAGSHLRRQRTRKGKLSPSGGGKDWFPLKSFIDLHADSSFDVVQQQPVNEQVQQIYGLRAKPHENKSSPLTTRDGRNSWTWRSFIEVANVS